LSETSFNSKKLVVALTLDIEPDCACCIAKNLGSSEAVLFSCAYVNVVNVDTETRTDVLKIILLKLNYFSWIDILFTSVYNYFSDSTYDIINFI
jgi:hypothetical protein